MKLAPAAPGARILGLGSVQPDNVVTNDDLAQRMDTDDQWIRDRVGIQSRRIADADTKLVDLAAAAGELAVKDAGLTPTDIDTVIVASCTMPNPIPNAAAQTAYKIGMSAPAAFDLNAACAGFCYAMGTAADLVRAGSSRHVLVIGAEKLSDWLDWDDRSTAIIFADAAGATVVGPAVAEDAIGIGPVAWGSAGDMANAIEIRDDQGRSRAGGGLYQEGQAVFRWATTQIAPVALRADRAGRAHPGRHRRVRAAPGQPAHRRGGGASDCGRRARVRTWSSPTTSCTRATPRRRRSPWRSTTCGRRAVHGAATWCCSSGSARASPTRPRSSSFLKIRQQTPSRRRNHRG